VDIIPILLVFTGIQAENNAVARLKVAAVISFGTDGRELVTPVFCTPKVPVGVVENGLVKSLAFCL
jgi:hypothetical protein